jgi:hypothetical protein
MDVLTASGGDVNRLTNRIRRSLALTGSTFRLVAEDTAIHVNTIRVNEPQSDDRDSYVYIQFHTFSYSVYGSSEYRDLVFRDALPNLTTDLRDFYCNISSLSNDPQHISNRHEVQALSITREVAGASGRKVGVATSTKKIIQKEEGQSNFESQCKSQVRISRLKIWQKATRFDGGSDLLAFGKERSIWSDFWE